MKFIGGFLAGVITTVLALFVISIVFDGSQGDTVTSVEDISGLTMLPEKGQCIIKTKLEVFQTLAPNVALAQSGEFPNETLVLLINHDGDLYYDGQKIKMAQNKCVRQIGTYQYKTKSEDLKTVPAVVIE